MCCGPLAGLDGEALVDKRGYRLGALQRTPAVAALVSHKPGCSQTALLASRESPQSSKEHSIRQPDAEGTQLQARQLQGQAASSRQRLLASASLPYTSYQSRGACARSLSPHHCWHESSGLP